MPLQFVVTCKSPVRQKAGELEAVRPTTLHMRFSTTRLLLISVAIVLCSIVVEYFPIWESSCGVDLPGLCGNQVLHEKFSPDKRSKAIVFQRDCGATTGLSTQVSIVPSWRKHPHGCGNVLVADTNGGDAPSGPAGGPVICLEWISSTKLKIIRHPKARVFLAQEFYHGISILNETNEKV